jgi:hypothetical protein
VLEKMEASTRVIPLLHHYPVSTEPEEMWEHGNVMLGFDAEERMIQALPQDFADKETRPLGPPTIGRHCRRRCPRYRGAIS